MNMLSQPTGILPSSLYACYRLPKRIIGPSFRCHDKLMFIQGSHRILVVTLILRLYLFDLIGVVIGRAKSILVP